MDDWDRSSNTRAEAILFFLQLVDWSKPKLPT